MNNFLKLKQTKIKVKKTFNLSIKGRKIKKLKKIIKKIKKTMKIIKKK